ncbi:MAG TPA: pyridoxal phosphate-dependent aminotransferase [Acidimicrobiia bacterium]|nr:pyridoxal phosphate-dependent aminotransferase [Acidimicrobiia bacterium]
MRRGMGAHLQPFTTTIFNEMSVLAARTGSINLGQGFPDTDGPAEVAEAAVAAIRAGHNQYPPGAGLPALRQAVADHQRRCYGQDLDPDTEVVVTMGATEAIAAAVLGLCEPGDEVVTLEPYYDSYAATIAMAGARRRVVTLRAPDFALDPDALASAVGPRTRLILLNSPHNPTGRVLSADELAAVARICVERDILAVTDEVYEHLVYDGRHIPLATLPGMAERTVTISSHGKTFSFTGWKVGWACGPADLIAAVRTTKQYLSYSGATPFQHAAVVALGLPAAYYDELAAGLARRRDLLCDGLRDAGLTTFTPQGTYFAVADAASLDVSDGMGFCLGLPERVGVVAVPMSVFYDDPDAGRTLVRFAFCKRPEILAEAAARLLSLRGTPPSPRGPRPA